MTEGQKKAGRPGGPRKKAKMDESVVDAVTQPLRLDTLAHEIISMIFEGAREVSAPHERLRYSLICKSLQPFGQEILYREVDLIKAEERTHLCVSAKPDWHTTDDERYESARRSVDFAESLLPALQAPQVEHFKTLSLDFGSAAVPPSWLRRALARLFLLFATSKATLHLLISSRSLDTTLVTLLTQTRKTAFRGVTVEILDYKDQKEPPVDAHALADVVMVEAFNDEHGFPECAAWTQEQQDHDPLWTLDDDEARVLYFISGHAKGLCQSLAAAAAVSTVELVPTMATSYSLGLLEPFQEAQTVKVDLREFPGPIEESLEVLRKLRLPASTTMVGLEMDEIRPSLSQLLILYHDTRWAPGIKVFRWQYWPDKDNPSRPATAKELALIEDGQSWQNVFATVLKDRGASLEMWVGENDWRVVIGNAEDGPLSAPGAVPAQTPTA